MALPQPAARFERQDFFAWEAEQSMKHDYVAGEVFAQAGARQDHVVVALNIATSLRQKLRGTPCRAYISDMQLEVVQADAVFYPDVMVSCHPEDLAAEEFKSLVPNLPLLQEIARRTGGRVVTPEELPALARELPSSPAPVMETITRPLWNTPAFFSLALAALLAEWGLRRWKGLP